MHLMISQSREAALTSCTHLSQWHYFQRMYVTQRKIPSYQSSYQYWTCMHVSLCLRISSWNNITNILYKFLYKHSENTTLLPLKTLHYLQQKKRTPHDDCRNLLKSETRSTLTITFSSPRMPMGMKISNSFKVFNENLTISIKIWVWDLTIGKEALLSTIMSCNLSLLH